MNPGDTASWWLGICQQADVTGLGFSPVWGPTLNIHDNCYPRMVEPSGERRKMVETYSIQIIMACVDSEPSTWNRLLTLVSPWTRLIDGLSKRCPCVSPLQRAGGGPQGWLPHVVFQGQPGGEGRQRRVSLAHHPGRGDDEPVDERTC